MVILSDAKHELLKPYTIKTDGIVGEARAIEYLLQYIAHVQRGLSTGKKTAYVGNEDGDIFLFAQEVNGIKEVSITNWENSLAVRMHIDSQS